MRTANTGRVRQQVGLLAVEGAAVFVAAAFLGIAIAGFTPGLTTHLDRLQWAGHHSGAMLFNAFEVSVLHNLLHLAFGIAGLLLAHTYARARAFLRGRDHALPEDVADMAVDALAHRLGLTWRASAEGETARGLIGRLLETVAPL